jgi:G6PDH family F420-dependent oxidoreductase
VGTSPDASLVERFQQQGGADKPRYGQVHVCYASSEAGARRIAREHWPNAALGGELGQVLPQPAHYEQAAATVREEDVAETVACGPDPEHHLEMIGRFVDAGYDHVYVHQIGPDQEGFFRFYADEVLRRVGVHAM